MLINLKIVYKEANYLKSVTTSQNIQLHMNKKHSVLQQMCVSHSHLFIKILNVEFFCVEKEFEMSMKITWKSYTLTSYDVEKLVK